MPASKAPKTRIKVEEITEAAPVVTESKKITSFSQLDSENVMPAEETSTPVLPQENTLMPESEYVSETNRTSDIEDSSKMSSEEVKEWLKDIRPDITKDVEKSGSGFNIKLFFVLLLVFAVIGALIGGLFYYKQKVDTDSMTATETPTPVEQVTPEPTSAPVVSVDLSKLNVNILNGSGIKGEAGKVKDLLTKAGFADANVKTANANSYDYTSTSVSLKKTVSEDVFDKVKSALGTGYEVVKASGIVKDTSTFDVEIIVGKK